ncbi:MULTISPECIES: carbamoyl-phosphate synthase (glutamine-hydrolyzing) large subunit [Exiguobacterium]|uniref:carbamoyl-phosphate synthase (glutamine-hydrolyzing) large subunit n=1 Tax=Exiguobacterium TaxID=33986 RepID=UPI001BE8AAF2|nr:MULTISPECIES: carbamoyl-phosphate synthase (glutamine-hydrolyzing) large subunit [Exiguobacterium]MCT4784141.1 carbamoyl-phosphate synthase (glutamine-hydrolyzing) large subunit [Exiguobacterium himgiriensis]
MHKKVLVIGSGPIIIGQAAEFDYSGTQACQALREAGCEVVLFNSNPATIMTDPGMADKTYIEAMTLEKAEMIIEAEQPTHVLATVGGQTALNLALALDEAGVLEKHGIALLGTSLETIRDGEDRERFKQKMHELGEPLPVSTTIETLDELDAFIKTAGVPLIVRPAFTLGGTGGGIATTVADAYEMARRGLEASPISQCLVEKSIAGFKEFEYEVMRDKKGTCIIVCNMENIDPVGVHTGDSVVFAPAQTLSDTMHQTLRSAALRIVSSLGVIGGCNIQFAVHPTEPTYYVIEVNPRVSRSSALASKATGYPIAKIATRLALGEGLDDCLNPVTNGTMASFEPTLDYVTAKVPCFPFDLFKGTDRALGPQMKATGESMAMGKTLEEALQKAWRGAGIEQAPLYPLWMKQANADTLWQEVLAPTDRRLHACLALMDRGLVSRRELEDKTGIAPHFMVMLEALVTMTQSDDLLTETNLSQAKRLGFTDAQIAALSGVTMEDVTQLRSSLGIHPVYHMVDTCAAEFESQTPYFYGTWHGKTEVKTSTAKKVAVIGAGPIRIGQGIEFDYSSVHAVWALQRQGIEAIMINNNPETVSTDFTVADRLYVEPLTLEDVTHVLEAEGCHDVLIQFGGQTGIALAHGLEAAGYHLLGASADVIDQMEDRDRFYAFLDEIGVAHIPGEEVGTAAGLYDAVDRIGFPCVVRPSYVIGGKGMHILQSKADLDRIAPDLAYPLLVDLYVAGRELEVDCVTDGQTVYVPAILEQIEAAGVHSGDSTMVMPPVETTEAHQQKIDKMTKQIGQALAYRGALNIQFVLKDDTIYVLEINPRASRTVPIVSKVTSEPLVEWATLAALGHALETIVPDERKQLTGYAVKTPIFSSLKLPGVDPLTGPIMRSTGETLQFSPTPIVAERFCYDATTTRVMARQQTVYGEGWETFGDLPLDATIDFQHVAVFFSNVPAEHMMREAAVRNGVHVISEKHLARYYQATVDTTALPVRSLQAMHTKEELPL